MHIRDPIHGAVEVTGSERALIDSPAVQRLRHVRQLGFAEVAFPGATHSRLSHSIGTMAVASRVLDAVFSRRAPSADRERRRLRQTLRLAALLHDLGHPPFSHASERGLPEVGRLPLPAWLQDSQARRATHEEMAFSLLWATDLGAQIARDFAGQGVTPEAVLALMSGRTPPGGSPFQVEGVDWAPLLQHIVSGEIDADRMDYLFRDSLYTGVNYGKFDLDWLVENLGAVVEGGTAWLALDRRAIFAFEDFLLSRHHMFMSVYFHRASIGYEHMLARWYETAEGPRLPHDPEAFLGCDDISLWAALREDDSPWARRIVERRPYRAVHEEQPGEAERWPEVRDRLQAEGLDVQVVTSRGLISKYLGRRRGIFVLTPGGVAPIEHYARLLTRHVEADTLVRVYVAPEDLPRAEAITARVLR